MCFQVVISLLLYFPPVLSRQIHTLFIDIIHSVWERVSTLHALCYRNPISLRGLSDSTHPQDVAMIDS